MTPTAESRTLACGRCGAAFGCGVATGACWCMEEDFHVPVPKDASADCLCPACLRQLASAKVVREA